MSSRLERRAGTGLALRMTLVNALLLAIAGIGLWLIAMQIVTQSLGRDWQLKREQVQAIWTQNGADDSIRRLMSEEHVMLSLPPAAQKRLEQHFADELPTMLVLLVGGALLLGGWLAFRQTGPLRRLAARAEALADDLAPRDRLLPSRRLRGDLAELAALFDRLLDRNADLVRTMHESLDHIGHDLRTPMTRLRVTAENGVASDAPESMREALGTCIEESERVLQLLTTLVDLSHAQSGTLALQRTSTDITVLLESVCDLYEFVAEERRVHLKVDAAAGLMAQLDPVRARQAIANCLDNAIKYGATDDVIDLRAVALPQGGVRVEIEDHGAGIPAADLPSIWQRLFRGDRARTSAGLGLGLSVVRAIVEAHGGRADAASEPGRTVISLEFPDPSDPGDA